MVTIVSKGRIPADQLYQVTCPNCGTLFRFARTEAREISQGQIDPPMLEIMCPLENCGNMCAATTKQPNYGR